jgi:hypothetical protein
LTEKAASQLRRVTVSDGDQHQSKGNYTQEAKFYIHPSGELGLSPVVCSIFGGFAYTYFKFDQRAHFGLYVAASALWEYLTNTMVVLSIEGGGGVRKNLEAYSS